jgi:hypothetical protein
MKAGIMPEQAAKVLDRTKPCNGLIERAARRSG